MQAQDMIITMNEGLEEGEALHGLSSVREASTVFEEFILRVSRIKEMHHLSSKLISGYQQELEKLRRPPLDESSSMVRDLLKSISSLRVARYQEAGCRHVHTDQQSFIKLNGFINGLKDHILGAQSLLEQIGKLVEEVTKLMDADLESTTEKELANEQLDGNGSCNKQELCCEESTVATWQASDYALLMLSIQSMLEKDLQLQELVVADLSLGVDSECLQTYIEMWLLRPFVDDALLRQAVSLAR